ncbi:hypothetical protein JCM1840_004240 [Sporobolomyces johnsonii]
MAQPPAQSQRYFCHECQHEGTDFPCTPDPVCPNCRGSFVEEIPSGDTAAAADDPRDFDPDDGPPLGLIFGPRGGGMAIGGGAGAGGGDGQPAFLRINIGPGGNFVTAGGGAAGPGGGGGQPMGLGTALLRALGIAPPVGAAGPTAGGPAERQGGGEPSDPEEQEAGRDEQGEGRHQVPIRNLATFLGEAFGDPQHHPADDPANNPFAEGGHDAPATPSADQQQREGASPGGNRFTPGGGAAAEPGNPLSYLLTLMNAFGFNGQVMGPGGIGLAGHAGDYVWGGEANFQALLNDLMEQAAGRTGPQPAPDDMIEKLPRIKASEDLLSHDSINDCPICQDAFQLSEELIPLPCRHLFHSDCIVPWLKTSGTCPVCRHALVPQPGQEGYTGPGEATAATGGRDGEAAAGPSNQGGAEVSGSGEGASSGAGGPPVRPPLSNRQSSVNAHLPSTARIPEVDGGSTLPGSWVFGEPMDVDEPEEQEQVPTTASSTVGPSDPAHAAAAAAERRAAQAREQREREAMHEPIIEDVD